MPDIWHKFTVKASPQKVFDAFCTEQGLNSWWTLKSSGHPTLHATYNFYFAPEYDWHARVIHILPGKELTWKMTGAMEDWMETEVGFRLLQEDDQTSVLFFHKGWKEVSDHYAISNYCWALLLHGLKQYVEKGTIIPFEKRN